MLIMIGKIPEKLNDNQSSREKDKLVVLIWLLLRH